MTLPYYAWEEDADLNTKDTIVPFKSSSLLDTKSWGSYHQCSEVTDGVFSSPDWICTANTSIDNTNFQSSKAAGWNNRLKRYFDTTQANLQYGPAQIAQSIIDYPNFFDFAKWCENGPHSSVHLLFGYSMKSMNSPDEPTFWLHHCNIDRVFHIWADCQGYDLTDPAALTDKQYQPANPLSVQKGAPAKLDSTVSPAKNCSVGLDDKIYYYWYPAKTISKVFPDTKWPTYRQMWSMGNSDTDTGFDGIYYRYGPDTIVATDCLTKNCPDKVWRWVNQPDDNDDDDSQKRSVEQKKKDHPIVQRLNEQFNSKVHTGLSSKEALRELAMEECNSIEKLKVTDDLLKWIQMNGGNLAEFDRICDKVDNAITEKKRINLMKQLRQILLRKSRMDRC